MPSTHIALADATLVIKENIPKRRDFAITNIALSWRRRDEILITWWIVERRYSGADGIPSAPEYR
jgi:hypothetical protein